MMADRWLRLVLAIDRTRVAVTLLIGLNPAPVPSTADHNHRGLDAFVALGVSDVIADCLHQHNTASLLALSSTCHCFHATLTSFTTDARRHHQCVVALLTKVDWRSTPKHAPHADTASFLWPGNSMDEFVAGRLYLPAAEPSPSEVSDPEQYSDCPRGLRWRDARLISDDVACLASAAIGSPNFRSRCLVIDLSGNAIGDAGVQCLAPLLAVLPHLLTCELAECALSDASVDILVGALATCCCLRHLALGANNIGDLGCTTLARALSQWPCLCVLQLGDTAVGDVGAYELAAALDAGCVPRLMQLWVAATRISGLGRVSLAEAQMRYEAALPRLTIPLRICW